MSGAKKTKPSPVKASKAAVSNASKNKKTTDKSKTAKNLTVKKASKPVVKAPKKTVKVASKGSNSKKTAPKKAPVVAPKKASAKPALKTPAKKTSAKSQSKPPLKPSKPAAKTGTKIKQAPKSPVKAAHGVSLSNQKNPSQGGKLVKSSPATPAPKVTPPSKPSLKVPPTSTPTLLTKKKVQANPQLIPDQTPVIQGKPGVMTPWLIAQKQKILDLHDSILDSMNGVAKDTLRSRAEGSEASAFGMHQADAGSDAYDRDFALSLLSQEQDALYEIEEALKRIELGTYGICEISGKEILKARLEAMPFARYTVECQAEIERQGKLHKSRLPVTSLFGLTDEESQDGEEDDQAVDTKE